MTSGITLNRTVTSSSTAGFGRRLMATLIDLLLLSILLLLLKMVFPDTINILFFKKISVTESATHWTLMRSSLIGLWIIYCVLADCTPAQGTIGKQLVGIAVTDGSGNRITVLRSIARNACKVISFVVLCFGFLNILIDKKHRGWHDLAANTLVVRKGS